MDSVSARLPAPALELITRFLVRDYCAQARNQPLSIGDPRRFVLPLVSKEWHDVLQLMPGLWRQVCITNMEIWPACGDQQPRSNALAPYTSAPPSLGSWFAGKADQVRDLNINLDCKGRVSCLASLSVLEEALTRVLECLAGGQLETLGLDVYGAPLLSCRAFMNAGRAGGGAGFPQLRELSIAIEGSAELSEAGNAQQAQQACQAIQCSCSLLERLALTLRQVKLSRMPPSLALLPNLRSLDLTFDSQVAQRPCPPKVEDLQLPGTLTELRLAYAPWQPAEVLQALSALPALHSCRLVL